jgi:hypothetical protein
MHVQLGFVVASDPAIPATGRTRASQATTADAMEFCGTRIQVSLELDASSRPTLALPHHRLSFGVAPPVVRILDLCPAAIVRAVEARVVLCDDSLGAELANSRVEGIRRPPCRRRGNREATRPAEAARSPEPAKRSRLTHNLLGRLWAVWPLKPLLIPRSKVRILHGPCLSSRERSRDRSTEQTRAPRSRS